MMCYGAWEGAQTKGVEAIEIAQMHVMSCKESKKKKTYHQPMVDDTVDELSSKYGTKFTSL